MTGASGERSSRLRQDARSAVPYAALSGALQILLSLIGMLLLVRYLRPDDYGVWMVLIGFGAPIAVFSSLGFRHSMLRFLPALESHEARRRFIWGVLFRRLFWVLLVCVVLNAAFPLYASRFGLEGQAHVLLLLSPSFLFVAGNQYLVVALNAVFRQREVFVGSLLLQTVSVGGVALGIYLEQGLLYFAAALLAANSVHLVFNLVASARYLGAPQWVDVKGSHVEGREEHRYRRTSFVDDIGTSLLSADINRFILAAFSSSSQVAVYAVATSIVERLRGLMPLEVFRPLATVTFFKRYEESGTIDEVNRMFGFIFAVNRIVTTAFLVLFIPLGYEAMVWVFREDYGASYLPVVLLLVAMGVLSMPIGLVAQALRRPQWLVYSKLAVLINVGLGIPLVMRYGAVGMASATAVSELVKNLIVYFLLRREFALRYPWASTFRFLVSGALVAAALWWLQGRIHFLIVGVVGALGWLIALRAFRVLDSDERALLFNIVPDRFQRVAGLLLGR